MSFWLSFFNGFECEGPTESEQYTSAAKQVKWKRNDYIFRFSLISKHIFPSIHFILYSLPKKKTVLCCSLPAISEKLHPTLAFHPFSLWLFLGVNHCFVPPPTGIHSYQRLPVGSGRSIFLPRCRVSFTPWPPAARQPLPIGLVPRRFQLGLWPILPRQCLFYHSIISSLLQTVHRSHCGFPAVTRRLAESFFRV